MLDVHCTLVHRRVRGLVSFVHHVVHMIILRGWSSLLGSFVTTTSAMEMLINNFDVV